MTKEQLEQMIQAIREFYDAGEPTDIKVLTIIDRILCDDFTGSGMYEELEAVLAKYIEGDRR
jgi:hypothetical protein